MAEQTRKDHWLTLPAAPAAAHAEYLAWQTPRPMAGTLDEHLQRLEDARARDHRKLGRELELFTFHPLAPASPFFLPKGAIVYMSLGEVVWIQPGPATSIV